MLFNWKGIALVLAALAAVIGLCALDLSCSAKPTANSTVARVTGELAVGRKEARIQEADNLAQFARHLRVLARQYVERGENRKAQRAIGAAQELDRKIKALRGE